MSPSSSTSPGRSGASADAQRLAEFADELTRCVTDVMPGWVDRVVRATLTAQGIALDSAAAREIEHAARRALDETGVAITELLARDIDEQRNTPLALLRDAVRYPTDALLALGATPVARDDFAQRSFPADVFDLTPASFADVDPALHEPGLVWGAAKAHVHLTRHRRR